MIELHHEVQSLIAQIEEVGEFEVDGVAKVAEGLALLMTVVGCDPEDVRVQSLLMLFSHMLATNIHKDQTMSRQGVITRLLTYEVGAAYNIREIQAREA